MKLLEEEEAEREMFRHQYNISVENIEKGMLKRVEEGFVDQDAFLPRDIFTLYKKNKFKFKKEMEKLIRDKYLHKYIDDSESQSLPRTSEL